MYRVRPSTDAYIKCTAGLPSSYDEWDVKAILTLEEQDPLTKPAIQIVSTKAADVAVLEALLTSTPEFQATRRVG